MAPAGVAVRTTVTVLWDSSHEAVESRNTICLAVSKPWVRRMMGVTTRTAQQVPSSDLVVLTSTPAKGIHRVGLEALYLPGLVDQFCLVSSEKTMLYSVHRWQKLQLLETTTNKNNNFFFLLDVLFMVLSHYPLFGFSNAESHVIWQKGKSN